MQGGCRTSCEHRPLALFVLPHVPLSIRRRANGPLRCEHVDVQTYVSASSVRGNAAPMPPSGPSPRRRETDERGFVLPVPGDVVTFAGRWPGEDAAGLVENVRYLPARGASVVDLVELRNVAPALYAPSRRRKWFDIAEVRLATDAIYDPAQDAYRVASVRTGYASVKPIDPDAKAAADAQYKQLKLGMLRFTVASAALGVAAFYAFGGRDISFAYSLGAAASILYLLMLQGSVDAVGGEKLSPRQTEYSIMGARGSTSFAINFGESLARRLLVARFLVPVLPFAVLSVLSPSHGFKITNSAVHGVQTPLGLQSVLGSVTRHEAAAVVVGLLTYKVPLVWRTVTEAVDTLAEASIAPGSVGMLGTAASLAARALKGRYAKTSGQDLDRPNSEAREKLKPIVVVVAGPSGVGKSSLLRQLFRDFPNVFDFCVSHTTRQPRDRENDGESYYFVDEDKFKAMIHADEFIEYARVHDNYYGTSLAAVNTVLASGRLCILDLDVQGVKALATRENLGWSSRFVWIAPPSMDALEKRLRRRGSETDESLARRLDTATREMTYAATSNVFDITIVNSDFVKAYEELKGFIASILQGDS